jgi:hypothetical protein
LIRHVPRACVQTYRRNETKLRGQLLRNVGGGAVTDHSEVAPGDF